MRPLSLLPHTHSSLPADSSCLSSSESPAYPPGQHLGDSCSCRLQTATLMVRPRGWHLPEKHILVNGRPCSGSIFDFAFYFFHNAKALTEGGSGGMSLHGSNTAVKTCSMSSV